MAGPWEQYQQAPRRPIPADLDRGLPAVPARFSGIPRERAAVIYTQQRARLSQRLANIQGLTPEQREQQILRFDTSPQVQAIRRVAGLIPVSTRQGEIRAAARRASQERDQISPTRRDINIRAVSPAVGQIVGLVTGRRTPQERSFQAGMARSMFGIPERLAAIGIPRSENIRNYDEALQAARASTDEEMSRSTAGNIFGQIAGSVASGFGVGRLITAGAGRMASAASPLISRAGNVLQRLTQLQQGQRVRNVARISAAGSAGGTTQAVGEGSDPITGAIIGAVAAPVFHSVIRGTIGASRIIRGAVGRRPADSILRSIVSSSPETIAARRAAIQRATGAEPTIYEALPLGDRQAFDKAVSRMPASARERLVEHVRGRAQNMVRETSTRAREIIRPQADRLTARIADDLARSRGDTQATAEEIELALRAARSPLDMEDVADAEAANIMRPFDDLEAYPAVTDLLPQHPVNRGSTVEMVADDPDVASMIRSAAGPLRIADRPVTVRDITAMMSTLSRTINRSGDHIERGTADRAIQHLEDILARDHPAVLPAVQRMRSTYAARMRMMEGVTEGSRTRLRENIDPSSNRASRAARNAYDSPEGTSGRTLGQAAQLERDILTSPNQALGALDEIATNPTAQTAIERNLGADEATALTDLARTQTESARRLSRLAREQTGDETSSEPLSLMRNLLSLSPGTMPFTKIQGILGTIRQFTRMPERSANRVVEMLLSQNPAQVSRAIGILSRTGEPGRRALRDIAISVGGLASSDKGGGEPVLSPAGEIAPSDASQPDEGEPATPEVPAEETGPWSTYNSEVPYGRQVVERLFPGIEVTEDIRDPNSDLGRANPGSNHINRDGAIDVRPIPGMTFEEYVETIRNDGHEIVEARNEVDNPSRHATGPHWHVVIA